MWGWNKEGQGLWTREILPVGSSSNVWRLLLASGRQKLRMLPVSFNTQNTHSHIHNKELSGPKCKLCHC